MPTTRCTWHQWVMWGEPPDAPEKVQPCTNPATYAVTTEVTSGATWRYRYELCHTHTAGALHNTATDMWRTGEWGPERLEVVPLPDTW
jgi:hypothetical protein